MLRIVSIITLLSGLVLGPAHAQDKTKDLAIIVAKDSLLENITSEEVVKIFEAEKTKGAGGHRLVLTTRELGSPERTAALATIYKMKDDEYETYFLRAIFAGRAQGKPLVVSSIAALLQFVATTPGAIGYARASEVDDTLKIIKVDGRLPGEAGYPFKIK